MNTKSISIIIVSILFVNTLVNSQNYGQYNPAGLYLGISSDVISGLGNSFTTSVTNYVENYPYPDQSGGSGSTSYTFSSFQVSLDLQDFYFNQMYAQNFTAGWTNVQFKIQFNYHICANTIFNPCEDGYIQVYTTNITPGNNTVILASQFYFDFVEQHTTLYAESTELLFDQGLIQIFVQCTNTLCVIPVNDIAQTVANDFVPTVTNGINDQLNTMMATLATHQPIVQFPLAYQDYKLYMDLSGTVEQAYTGSGLTPMQTAQFLGQLIASGNTVVEPPFTPSFTPAADVLENIAGPIQFTITPFFLQSLMYTGLNVMLPKTITPAEVPSSSPVQLNTSDSFFSQVASGLLNYPNLGMQVEITMPEQVPQSAINASGIYASFGIDMAFTILSNPPISAFGVGVTLQLEIFTEANAIPFNDIEFSSKLTNLIPNATITSSAVGDVDPTGFDQLFQMFQAAIQIPSFNMTLPKEVTISSVSFIYGYDYIQMPIICSITPSFDDIFNKDI